MAVGSRSWADAAPRGASPHVSRCWGVVRATPLSLLRQWKLRVTQQWCPRSKTGTWASHPNLVHNVSVTPHLSVAEGDTRQALAWERLRRKPWRSG